MITRACAVLLCALLLAPSVALAQASKAGIVTTLEGNVTARRIALPAPVALKFKDDVFLQDTVTTGDRSLARMLLGGKAVVTVRERSVVTITEVPGRSTIDLDTGKFALAVAREKMKPGEEILIRTPNAVAGVRGTVVVTEVNRQGAQAGGGNPAVLTSFYVLRGTIMAQQLDPNTRQPTGTPLQIGTLQAYSQAGNAAPRVAPVPPEHVGQITSGLQPSGPKSGSDVGQEHVKMQAVQTAVTLIGALTGTGPTQVALAVTPPAPPPPPVTVSTTAPINTFTHSEEALQDAKALQEENALQDVTALADQLDSLVQQLLGIVTFTGTPARSFSSAFSSTSTSPLLSLTDATVFQSGDTSFVQVQGGADVTLAGPLLSFVNSSLFTEGKLLEIQGGKLTSTSTEALISLDPSAITAASALIVMNGGSLSLAGPLLIDTDGLILSGQEFLRMSNGASLTSSGTDALVQLNGTTIDDTAALSMTSSSMSLAGPLLSVSNLGDGDVGLTSVASALFLLDASSITSATTHPLMSFSFAEAEPDGNFLRLVNGSTISLAGPLFSASHSVFESGLPTSVRSFFGVFDGSSISSTTTSALIAMTDSVIDTQGPFFSIRRSPSTSQPSKVTLAGPLFSGSSLTINTTSLGFASTFGTSSSCCSVFSMEQGSLLSSTTSSPLITLASSTVTLNDAESGGSLFNITDTITGFPSAELVAPSTVSLAGPLLSASHTTLTPLFALLTIARSSLGSSSGSALISLANSTVTAGGTDISGNAVPGRIVTLISAASPFGTSSTPASVSLAGPLLASSSSTLNLTQIFGVFGGAAFSSTTQSPLITLDNTALKLTTATVGVTANHGELVSVGGQGGSDGVSFASLSLKGPLLSITGGALETSSALATVFTGGKIVEEHPSSPFVSITGGTHTIGASGHALLALFGRSSASTVEVIDTSGLATSTSSLTLGTDEPLKRTGSGAFLETSSTTINAQAGLTVDRALLSASAPLLHLKSGTTLTTAGDMLNLTANARLTATGPLVKLDAATLNVTGHAIRVLNGSFLTGGGHVVALAHAAKLNITSGGALFVSGDSVVKISGGLVNFSGTGNQVSISNNLTPNVGCSTQCGPFSSSIRVQNGATAGNISISSNAIKNSSGNTFSVSGAAIILDGANSKVIIGGN
jgi:hypothetical protein